jgi:hypothetical protein
MNPYREALERACNEKVAATMANRERLLEAWVAETGLLPSESVLCESTAADGDRVVTRVWVERRP